MSEATASGTPREKRVGDRDEFEVKGRRFRLTIHADDLGAPWDEHDMHGVVSEWTSREMREGERVLNVDGRIKRYYDIDATLEIARTKWGCADDAAAAQAVEFDFQRLYGWCNDQWHWVWLKVELVGGRSAGEFESLGGVESDSEEYISECAYELAEELAARVYKQEQAEAKRMPNKEQLEALVAWAARHRRDWKQKLDWAWMRAGEGVSGYSPLLQQVRNDFGPSWLQCTTLKKIQAALKELT